MKSVDENGLTPLHCAAQGGHREVVEVLIAKDADINTVNKNGWPPCILLLRKAIGRLPSC